MGRQTTPWNLRALGKRHVGIGARRKERQTFSRSTTALLVGLETEHFNRNKDEKVPLFPLPLQKKKHTQRPYVRPMHFLLQRRS